MRLIIITLLLFIIAPLANAFTTEVNETTRRVTVYLDGLPPDYVQIELQGVVGLIWCPCLDDDNPRSMASTGFTVNGIDLEMQYEGGQPRPTDNFIEYTYDAGYTFTGFNTEEWVLIKTEEDEVPLMGPMPILIGPVFNKSCDFDGDGYVLGNDISELFDFFNTTSPRHDVDNDGFVLGSDVAICTDQFNQ
jgi:hypothetical protein